MAYYRSVGSVPPKRHTQHRDPDGVLYYEDNETRKFTQEIRLSASVAERFDWLAGVFYTHESTRYQQNNIAEDPAAPAAGVMPAARAGISPRGPCSP